MVRSRRLRSLLRVALALAVAIVIALPVHAAQRLIFVFPPINRSLGIESLATFAKTGTVNRELADYFRLVNVDDTQKAAFREALLKPVPVNPLHISRFFNTPTGEAVLERVGLLINVQGGRNGKFALRGAMVQAALDQKNGGLTLLNFLQHLPTNMQFNLTKILEEGQLLEQLARGTDAIIAEIGTLSAQQAKSQDYDFTKLPDLRQTGSYGTAEPQTWTLTDPKRKRRFYTLVYQPQRWRDGKTPVVVMSHGLASRPEDFALRAKHLASYGYLVLLPQHPGSDTLQMQAMLNGTSRELFKLNEFVDRHKDLSFVIDELERRNGSEYGGRLDLKNVVAVGHSFGGYTALALGGATIDFDNLKAVCDRNIWGPNLSLLLQCRALALPRQAYDFRDERVQSVLTINTVSSSIFGEKGHKSLKIPTFIGAGSNDPATPLAIEQLRSFVWLKIPEKYLVLIKGQAHVNFTKLDANVQVLLESIPEITLPQQSLIDQYADALLVAFSEVYGAKNESFRPFLTAAYGKYLSQQPHPVYLVDESADVPLSAVFNRYKPGQLPPLVAPQRAEKK